MKINDIINESSYDDLLQRIADTDDPTERAELIARLEKQFGGVGQGLKPEERLGSKLWPWLKKKLNTDPIADKTAVALAGRNRRNGRGVAKASKDNSALDYDDAGYEKYDNPADASTIADLEKADYDSEMAQWNADNKKRTKDNSQAIVNTEKSKRDQAQDNKKRTKDNSQAIVNTEKSKRDQAQKREKQKELARLKANAGMKDSDYKTPPSSKRTAQDLALDKEYTYKADDGRRLKYKQGDIRNAFHSSPDSRKAGSDKVIRGDRVGKRLVDKKPVPRTNQDDRAK